MNLYEFYEDEALTFYIVAHSRASALLLGIGAYMTALADTCMCDDGDLDDLANEIERQARRARSGGVTLLDLDTIDPDDSELTEDNIQRLREDLEDGVECVAAWTSYGNFETGALCL